VNTTARSRNFHFSSQRPHPIHSIGKFQRTIFVWLDAKLGTEDRLPQREFRNCWLRPSHPVLSNTLWIDFPPPTAPAFPREATVRQFAGAYCQTIVSSGGFRLTAANNSGHVSPAVHPSSPDVAVKRGYLFAEVLRVIGSVYEVGLCCAVAGTFYLRPDTCREPCPLPIQLESVSQDLPAHR
jgi:hypothetical protein